MAEILIILLAAMKGIVVVGRCAVVPKIVLLFLTLELFDIRCSNLVG
jgi:hypothetical protein